MFLKFNHARYYLFGWSVVFVFLVIFFGANMEALQQQQTSGLRSQEVFSSTHQSSDTDTVMTTNKKKSKKNTSKNIPWYCINVNTRELITHENLLQIKKKTLKNDELEYLWLNFGDENGQDRSVPEEMIIRFATNPKTSYLKHWSFPRKLKYLNDFLKQLKASGYSLKGIRVTNLKFFYTPGNMYVPKDSKIAFDNEKFILQHYYKCSLKHSQFYLDFLTCLHEYTPTVHIVELKNCCHLIPIIKKQCLTEGFVCIKTFSVSGDDLFY